MAAKRFTNASRATDSNSTPLPGALLAFYKKGTETPATIYADGSLTTRLTNPVAADSGGLFPAIYLDDTAQYRAVLKTAQGAVIEDIDPVNEGLAGTLAQSVDVLNASIDAAKIRSNHTGTQTIATVSGLQTALDSANAQAALAISAAATAGKLYADTTTGIAGTTDGDYFLVVGSGDTFATLYKNVSGTATAQSLVLPSSTAIPNVVTGGEQNLFDESAVTTGTEIYSDGTLHSEADSTISELIPVYGAASIYVSGMPDNPGMQRYYRFLDAGGAYLAASVGSFADGINEGAISVPAGAYYFQITPIQRYATGGSLSAIQIEVGTSASDFVAFRRVIKFIDWVSAQATAETHETTGDINLFDKTATIQGYEVYGDGTLNAQADSEISQPMWIRGASSIYVSGLPDNPGQERWMRFLAADKSTVVGHISIADGENQGVVAVPSTAYYVQITPRQRYATKPAGYLDAVQVEVGSSATAYQVYSPRIVAIDGTPIKGASTTTPTAAYLQQNVVVFGDSITETEDVDSGQYVYGSGYRANWPDYLSAALQPASFYNFAKSGAHFASASGLTTNQKFEKQIDNAVSVAPPANLVIVALGTNDWGNSTTSGGGSVVLGSYATAMATDYASLDLTVSIEAARKGFYRIAAQWPDAVKICALPTQRADFTPDAMQSWVDEIAQMARRYGFVVVNNFAEAGILNDFEVVSGSGQDLVDGLHPKSSGMVKINRGISAKARELLA